LRKKGGKNIVDEKRVRLEAAVKEQNERGRKKNEREAEIFGPALARFVRKGA